MHRVEKIKKREKVVRQLNSLGQICEYFKHLGIYISFDFNKAKQLTYDNLIKKLETKKEKSREACRKCLFQRIMMKYMTWLADGQFWFLNV